MNSLPDQIAFVAMIAVVFVFALTKGKQAKEDSASYFLAGRSLPWWIVGVSLIAANISTEQFVGMSGASASRIGLAIASYEWLAAITLVIVAYFFLPYFLRAGVFTIPEYLERRYDRRARAVMAAYMVGIYVFLVAAVIYSGALTLQTAFGDVTILGVLKVNVQTASYLIGLIAAIYVFAGGLKSCAWADLLQGGALLLGGALVLLFALRALGDAPTTELTPAFAGVGSGGETPDGALSRFLALNSEKLHMILPASDPFLPWTALLLGLWIPNLYYWGLNQYVVQRALGSRSLAEGQKGVVFAAGLKLVIPFIIIFPGMIAFNLYSDDMREIADTANAAALETFEDLSSRGAVAPVLFDADEDWVRLHPERAAALEAYNARVNASGLIDADAIRTEKLIGYKYDSAFGLLVRKVLPNGVGVQGFVMAALMGAVISSLAAMLNAASTIFTLDLFKTCVYRALPAAREVLIGRVTVVVLAVVGSLAAPILDDPNISNSIFAIIQEGQAYVYPGVLAVFLAGLLMPRVAPLAGVVGLLASPVLFGLLKYTVPSMGFVNRASAAFVIVLFIIACMSWRARESAMRLQPTSGEVAIDLEESKSGKLVGGVVIAIALLFYVIFW